MAPCQLCKSSVPKFEPGLWNFHIIGHGATSYVVPCSEEDRAKMEEANKRLAEMDARNAERSAP